MTFADIAFFTMNREVDDNGVMIGIPLSRARNEVPLMALNDPAQYFTGSANMVFEAVKVRRDPGDQTVQLPIKDYYNSSEFMERTITNLERSNIACIRFTEVKDTAAVNDPYRYQWYYLMDYREMTNRSTENSGKNISEMNVEVDLEFIPLTTYQPVSGIYLIPERMPTPTAHVRQNWTQSIMETAAANTPIGADVGQIVSSDGTYTNQNVFWAEIDYTGFSGTTPDGLPIGDNKIRRVGVFVTGEGGTRMQSPVPPTGDQQNSYYWMLLDELIQDPLGALNLTGTVCAINVSQFCPYAVLRTGTEYSIDMSLSTPLMPGSVISGTNYRAYYDIDSLALNYQQVTHNHKIITITLTDFEVENGQLVIRDHNKNVIMDIPVEKNATSMTITEDTFADVSGIYTRFTCGDSCIIHNGTSLPWGTSAWEQYRTYNMAYDRQALQNNIDSAYRSMNVTVLNGVSNAVIGGGVAGGMKGGTGAAGLGVATGLASAGTSIIGGALQTKYAIKEARIEQDLTEQRMRGSPMTANNLAAGTNYIIQIHRFGGCRIDLMMPAGFTEDEWNAQTQEWGFPSNKVCTYVSDLTTGYWKGRMLPMYDGITDSVVIRDMAIRQLEDGAYIVVVTDTP